MRFVNKTGDGKVDIAINAAEELLKEQSKMMVELRSKQDWRYDSGSGADVVANLLKEKAVIPVYFWSSWRPTSAVGYFDGAAIHINKSKMPFFSTADLLGLLLHEYSHYQGFHHVDPGWLGRRRANYKTEEKCLYSVPYFISENVARWL